MSRQRLQIHRKVTKNPSPRQNFHPNKINDTANRIDTQKTNEDLEKLGDVEADVEKNRRCAFMGHGVGGTYRECACLESQAN